MGTSTAGNNDNQRNHCGVNQAHAYALLTTFTIPNAAAHEKVLLMKNPWGITYYSGKWNYNDPEWNTVGVNSVPFGIDPRTSHLDGIFVVPVSALA